MLLVTPRALGTLVRLKLVRLSRRVGQGGRNLCVVRGVVQWSRLVVTENKGTVLLKNVLGVVDNVKVYAGGVKDKETQVGGRKRRQVQAEDGSSPR